MKAKRPRNKTLDGVSPQVIKQLEALNRKGVPEGYREIVYYNNFGDPTTSTIATVLIVGKETDTLVAKGIAIRSPLDTMNKPRARLMARGRALRALETHRNSSPIVPNTDVYQRSRFLNTALSYANEVGITFKAMYLPTPTARDIELIAGERVTIGEKA